MDENAKRLFSEDDLLPLSALQHLLFCERQCALIHLEQAWSENRLTAEGRVMHQRVHEQEAETRGDVRIIRGLRLRSLRLGLAGQADVVEYHRNPDGSSTPYPVEYKHGRPKADAMDEVQLCAQAMCLEEMLGVSIASGALFYGKTCRRTEVFFSPELRQKVESAARRLHELIDRGMTPPAVYEKKCESCSLLDNCQPQTLTKARSVKAYLAKELQA